MKFVLWIFILSLSLQVESFEKKTKLYKTPKYILPCRKSDPELDKCAIKSIEHLRPYMIEGIEEIDLSSIEPMIIKENITFKNGEGAFNIKANFSYIVVEGTSNYSIKSVKLDVHNYTLELKVGIPLMEIRGLYDGTATILRLPMVSKGDFRVTLLDIAGAAKIYGKEVTNEGVKFIQIDNVIIKFTIGKSVFKIRDLFNKEKRIAEIISQLLSTNSEEIMEEIKPEAAILLADRIKIILNGVFLKIPLRVWLPDS